jgi:hypothetical protein
MSTLSVDICFKKLISKNKDGKKETDGIISVNWKRWNYFREWEIGGINSVNGKQAELIPWMETCGIHDIHGIQNPLAVFPYAHWRFFIL